MTKNAHVADAATQAELVGALTELVNAVDYTQVGKAKITSMLGQVLDRKTIARARAALKHAKG